MEALDEKRSRSVLLSLYKTWKERLYCDITLKCGSKTIQAHKLVLISVSDYFKNLFKYEVTKIEYDLDCNIFKDSIIEHIVLFAYTGKIKIDGFIVQDLLVAASFLQIKFIIFECEKFMAQNIELDNIIPLVSLTNQFNLKSLLGPVCNFISSNFQELSNNGGFFKLTTSDFKMLLHSENLSVFEHGIPVDNPELALLKLVGMYLSITSVSNQDFQEASVSELLDEIRFDEIQHVEDLKSVVDLHPIVHCEKIQNILNHPDRPRSDPKLPVRKFANSVKKLRRGRTYASGLQENDVIKTFGESWTDGRDLNDRPVRFTIWIRRWDDRPVLGGISIRYRSGKEVVHGGKPQDLSLFVSEHEVNLEENEVVTNIIVRSGFMIDNVKFLTNFGREYGPFGGPGGSENEEYFEGHSYLHSLDGNVVLAQGYLGITCLRFMWITFGGEDFVGDDFSSSESEEDDTDDDDEEDEDFST